MTSHRFQKQENANFLTLRTMEGSTDGIIQVAAPLIVTGEEHRFLASEQLREAGITLGSALLEPTGRNTAQPMCSEKVSADFGLGQTTCVA